MTATVLGILAVLIAAIPIYFLAKSNARENERQRQARVDDAVRPVQQALDRAALTIRDRDQRIQQLEDQLYGGHR